MPILMLFVDILICVLLKDRVCQVRFVWEVALVSLFIYPFFKYSSKSSSYFTDVKAPLLSEKFVAISPSFFHQKFWQWFLCATVMWKSILIRKKNWIEYLINCSLLLKQQPSFAFRLFSFPSFTLSNNGILSYNVYMFGIFCHHFLLFVFFLNLLLSIVTTHSFASGVNVYLMFVVYCLT